MFATVLRKYTKGRTLQLLSDELAARGFTASRVTISRWRSGERGAPDDIHLVKAMAEICGRDPEPLLLAAQIERQPAEVFRSILRVLGDGDAETALLNGLDHLATRLKEQSAPTVATIPSDMAVTVIIGAKDKIVAQFTKPFACSVTNAEPPLTQV